MKSVFSYFLIGLTLCTVSSCDFFRSLAGRPTSEDLSEQNTVQTTEIVEEADPLPLENSGYQMKKRQGRLNVVFAYTHTNSTLKAEPEYKYYIVVGTYRQKPTRNKMISDARNAGYETYLLEYDNGLTSVALLPCDDLGQAIDAFAQVKQEKFCPKDACVLIAK
ncbi:MAG: hypothetical protein ACI4TL_06900 [Candidatus Cryptobacteroides sp.]